MKKILSNKIVIGVGVAVVLIIAGYYFTHRSSGAYQFVTVTKGSISEVVSVTGNTAPEKSVSLSFGNSGIVAGIYSSVGKRVSAGTVLAVLDSGDLLAQRKQAEANVSAQKAKLQTLVNGSRPEDLEVSQASLSKAQQDLSNMYASVSTAISTSYNSANDAVNVQLANFFSNADTNPQLNFSSSNSQFVNDATTKRGGVNIAMRNWQTTIASLSQSSTNADIEASVQTSLKYLATVQDFFSSVTSATNLAITLPPGVSTVSALKTLVTTAVTEVNTSVTSLNTISQNIASQKQTIAGLQASLDLKKAGSTAEDVATQQAQVDQAQASVDSISAKLRSSQIVTPQDGIITQFDAKVGQTASPSVPLVSIISDNAFEIDASVSEIDVGKISLDNKVSMTIDAFPNETFTGKVFYIDPAQTNNSGVIGYKIKVAFDKPDARMKSGLTVNLNIETRHKDNVLVLPQYAILQNDSGNFVETLENKVVKQNPVTLGLSDQKGNVEIIFGVSEGEQVLNIGLKK